MTIKMIMHCDARARAHLIKHAPSGAMVSEIRGLLQGLGHDGARDVLMLKYGLYENDAEEIVLKTE